MSVAQGAFPRLTEIRSTNAHTTSATANIPSSIQHVEVIENGPNLEFSLVSIVPTAVDGELVYSQFLDVKNRFRLATDVPEGEFATAAISQQTGISQPELKNILVMKNKLWTAMNTLRKAEIPDVVPGQFLWDPISSDWILVDWGIPD
jgi:hypothetical protein